MGKEFKPQGNFQRGPPKGPFNRGGPGGPNRGGPRGPRGGFDQGPPAYVVPYASFLHKAENSLLVKCTDMSRFPKFNRSVYLENKAKIGSVDQILGPINAFYFSIKPVQGVDPKSFKEGQTFYMNPEDLLSTDKFTRPQTSRPRGSSGGKKFGGPAGGPGGKPFQRGGFNNRGGPQGGFNRGGPQGGRPFNKGPGGRPPFKPRS